MLAVALAILPVVAAILLGYLLKMRGVPQPVWHAAERSVFFLFLPALAMHQIAVRDVRFSEVMAMVLPTVAIVLGIGVVAYWSARRLTFSPPPTAAAVHQASIRLNGVLMIALAPSLLGVEVWPYVAVMTSLWPALSNTTSILVFVRATGRRGPPVQTFLAVLKNPIVIAILIGVALNLAGLGPLVEAFGLLNLLGHAALPVGLLAVGAALEFSTVRRSGPPTLLATVLKLVLMPVVMWGLCVLFALPPLITQLMVISAALPSSPSGYVLASQMGGDGPVTASAITLQHVLGLFSVAIVAGLMLAR
jgi:malonate transporter and related proteins